MQLASLPEATCHQLAIDLGYLCDVLDDLSMVEVSLPPDSFVEAHPTASENSDLSCGLTSKHSISLIWDLNQTGSIR